MWSFVLSPLPFPPYRLPSPKGGDSWRKYLASIKLGKLTVWMEFLHPAEKFWEKPSHTKHITILKYSLLSTSLYKTFHKVGGTDLILALEELSIKMD